MPETDLVVETKPALLPPIDPAIVPDAAPAPVVPSPALATSFAEVDDGKRYHAAQAQIHLNALGFKTQLEPTALTIWTEVA